jgi:acyl-CoA thioesterase-1
LNRSINIALRFSAIFGLLVPLWLGLGAINARADMIRGVGFGDSLMAGYQLPQGAGFPEQLENELRQRGYDVSISNAGVSGDTSSGGLSRIDWSVPDDTDFVILELGANDALRGISPSITRDNLDQMIERLSARGIDVILAGMVAPPNMGEDYRDEFDRIYRELADEHDVPLYPFFLDGAISLPEKMLPDGIHPNAEGVAAMVERFVPLMTDYLDSASGAD